MLLAGVFVAIVGTVFVAAAVVLLRRFVLRPARPVRSAARAVLVLAAAGLVCIAYGRFIEPRWVEVTRTSVPTPRLPPGHRGVRIVHLSDLHSDPSPRLEERVPDIVAGLRPDLIVFTGDAANSPEGMPIFRTCLSALAKIAPTFVVKGNWDVWHGSKIDFGGTGATELNGTAAEVVVAGTTVRVAGAAYGSAASRLGQALEDMAPDGPAVVLFHQPYPDVIPAEFAARVDLLCAGHVHGGQVALPFYGALITMSKYGKKYERGLYRTDEGPFLYVNRGIGMDGGPFPRVRFASRPEVALIELVPAAK